MDLRGAEASDMVPVNQIDNQKANTQNNVRGTLAGWSDCLNKETNADDSFVHHRQHSIGKVQSRHIT